MCHGRGNMFGASLGPAEVSVLIGALEEGGCEGGTVVERSIQGVEVDQVVVEGAPLVVGHPANAAFFGKLADCVRKFRLQHESLVVSVFHWGVLHDDVECGLRIGLDELQRLERCTEEAVYDVGRLGCVVVGRDVSQSHVWNAVVGRIPHDNFISESAHDVWFVGFEDGKDMDPSLGEDAGIESCLHFGDSFTVYVGGLEHGEVVRGDGDLVSEGLSFPVFQGRNFGLSKRYVGLLAFLSEECEGNDGKLGIGAAF